MRRSYVVIATDELWQYFIGTNPSRDELCLPSYPSLVDSY